MRGRKRLRKKLQKKKANKAKIKISLELGATLSQDASYGIIKQFKNECLKPVGLLFDAKQSGIGWDGQVENTNSSQLTEEHREMIAEWAFMQEEVNSYSISQLSSK